jgi:four helix bundle protein
MTPDRLRERTAGFAADVIAFVRGLPRSVAAQTIGEQLVRSASSVGANYRAACRAQSPNDFIAKLALVEQEADEARYWLELSVRTRLVTPSAIEPLAREGGEILAMTVASIRTAKAHRSSNSRR